MAKIKLNDQEFEISNGETILDCLRNNNINIRSSCGGHATCTDCVIKIKNEEKSISKVTFEEKQLLGNVFFITKERLACQTKLVAEKVVEIEVKNLD